MDTVVFSWNPGEDEKKWTAFRKTMEKIFVSIKTDSFKTDKKHIFFATDKETVDGLIKDCTLLICPEVLNGKAIGTGTLKAWKKLAPEGLKVITVLDGSRYGGGKLKGLFDNGFLDALFEKDFVQDGLLNVIKASRTEAEAFAYYGLDGYVEKKVRKKKEETGQKEESGQGTGEDTSDANIPPETQSDVPVLKDDKDKKENRADKDTAPKENAREEILKILGEDKGDKEKEKPLKKAKGRNAGNSDSAFEKPALKKEKVPDKVLEEQVKDIERPDVVKDGKEPVKKGSDKKKADKALAEQVKAPKPSFAEQDVPGSVTKQGMSVTVKEESVPDAIKGMDASDGVEEEKSSNNVKGVSLFDTNVTGKSISPAQAVTESVPDALPVTDMPVADMPSAVSPISPVDIPLPSGDLVSAESPAMDAVPEVPLKESASPDTATEPSGTMAELVDFESHGKEGADDGEEVEEDALKIFTLPEDSLVTYLKECDSEAHSYVRPYPELSKTDMMLEELLDYYTVQNNTWIQNVNNNAQIRDQFEAELRQRIAGNDLDLTVSEREQVFDEFSRFMWRYDILEPYILDPDVSDIKVYDPWTVQIKVKGKKMAAPTTFRSNLHYRGFIGRIAKKNHVDINNKGLARFADTLTYNEVRLRGNIATELLNCNGSPLIHMRKVNNTKFTTEKLIALKMMTPATAAYLVWCIRNGKSIVFCGKGSSGKTTITNWLIDFFPLWLSALCIQEIDELYSVTHPYIQFQQITSDIELLGDTEGKQKYTLRDLAINGLLTDIDAFLIGEIKGPEALQFTNSANTGNQCLCTVHAEHEREALPQIADYSKFGSDYSRADLLKRLTSIDVVVFMQDFQVKSISEVAGWDEDRQDIVYRSVPIVVPEKIGVEEKHKIMGAERRLFVAA